MHIRQLIAIAALAVAPRVAVAQFTTFIPPQPKVTDSVKAVVAAEAKAREDSVTAERITNMKVWVDSAAGVVPAPNTAADSLAAGGSTTTADSVTMPNGSRAPATASSLPLIAFAGVLLLFAGGAVIRGAPARRRA